MLRDIPAIEPETDALCDRSSLSSAGIFLVWLVLALGCGQQQPEVVYLRTGIDSLYHYSLHAAQLDRDTLRLEAVEQLTDTSTRAHSHAILHAIVQRIDRHSSLLLPSEVRAELRHEEDPALAYPFSTRLLKDRVALMRVDGFTKGDSLSCAHYADSLQRAVLHLHAQEPIAWLIDLRLNSGGNLYPMLAGLGPLLGCGDLGWDVDARDVREAWWYCRDAEHLEGDSHITLVRDPMVFNDTLPLIVLVGRRTASAGEALAMSFIGRPRTQLFGERTAGYTTGNRMCFLADSALLNITNAVMMDRTGGTHPEGIEPDVRFEMEGDAFQAALDSLVRMAGGR